MYKVVYMRDGHDDSNETLHAHTERAGERAKKFENQMLGIRDDALLKAAGVRKGYAPMKVFIIFFSRMVSSSFFSRNITWHPFKTHTQRPQNLGTCDGNNSSSIHTHVKRSVGYIDAKW
jgi:hypothetical protein